MEHLNKKQIKNFFKGTKRKHNIVLLLENIQYAKNVASMFRTADAAGVKNIYLTGISHKPPFGKELSKVSRQKHKSMSWEYVETTDKVIKKLKKDGFFIIAVELTDDAVDYTQLSRLVIDHEKICFVLGSEVYGVVNKTLEKCDASVYIPMFGKGASLNVSVSAGIILYSL
jgi:tRNA G18 (ribose-2'-O)-methylase SpoU